MSPAPKPPPGSGRPGSSPGRAATPGRGNAGPRLTGALEDPAAVPEALGAGALLEASAMKGIHVGRARPEMELLRHSSGLPYWSC